MELSWSIRNHTYLVQVHSISLRGLAKTGLLILFFFFLILLLFIYLFLAVLGLCCCARAFSSCGEQGLLFVAVRGLLIVVASLVAEHGLHAPGLQELWPAGS